MFTSIGLFKKIPCPQRHDCLLINCMFDHDVHTEEPKAGVLDATSLYDPSSAGSVTAPPLKRRRIDGPEVGEEASKRRKESDEHDLVLPMLQATPPAKSSPRPVARPTVQQQIPKSATTNTVQSAQSSQPVHSSKPASAMRPVSPPTKDQLKPALATKIEKLIPRPVARAPVQLNSRITCLKMLHGIFKDQNDGAQRIDSAKNDLILLDHELVKLALDDEQEVANSATSSEIYRNVIAQKVLRAKKMSRKDWEALVATKFRQKNEVKPVFRQVEISTGLTAAQEIEILRGIKTAVAGLESYGYVTSAPSAADIQKAKTGVSIAGGYETCDRCTRRFQVFPGRDSEGRLTTHGPCYYHWGKVQRVQTAKSARMTGHADASYPCCGSGPGSEGCTKADTHVYKVSDPKRLASLLQFEKTPAQSDSKRRAPVAFDCEMAYTTCGMELIRVTAVSWPDNMSLLDVLVRPYGEVLDLNTRFSGVTTEQFANALPYRIDDAQKDSTGNVPLSKASSPAAARDLMFKLLTPDTPLIGHAIENDLNACRMIHPFIVDTVLLYPHPRGLPIRFGLKALAFKYLGRGIQMAGEQGHDSKEDSIATGDLVRVKVADKWRNMQQQGWTFQDGRLVLAKR